MPEKNLQDHINKDVNEDIRRLYDHAKIANEEMGRVQKSIGIIETDLHWMKDKLEKVDGRSWWILGTVILGIIVQIYMKTF